MEVPHSLWVSDSGSRQILLMKEVGRRFVCRLELGTRRPGKGSREARTGRAESVRCWGWIQGRGSGEIICKLGAMPPLRGGGSVGAFSGFPGFYPGLFSGAPCRERGIERAICAAIEPSCGDGDGFAPSGRCGLAQSEKAARGGRPFVDELSSLMCAEGAIAWTASPRRRGLFLRGCG